MTKFRKKPAEIDAIQFDGSFEMAMELHQKYADEVIIDPDRNTYLGGIIIPTPEGRMVATKGDWIIIDAKGKRYPCRQDIFEATYEKA